MLPVNGTPQPKLPLRLISCESAVFFWINKGCVLQHWPHRSKMALFSIHFRDHWLSWSEGRWLRTVPAHAAGGI